MPKKQSKRFKHETRKRKHIKQFKHETRKIKHIKQFNPTDVRLREKRLLAVEQEAESRYQYHQLRIRSNQQ